MAPLRQDMTQLLNALEKLDGRDIDLHATPDTTRPRSRERAAAASSPGAGCQVSGCEAAVLAKQLCETHYRIMRRAAAAGEEFDLQAQRPARARIVAKQCTEPDCNEAHYAKGLCRRHYMSERSRIRASGRASGRPPGRQPRSENEEPSNSFESGNGRPTNGSGEVAAAQIAAREAIQNSFEPARLRTVTNPFTEDQSYPGAKSEALPTAEMVARVVAQYRGGLDRVAEVLGRNKRTLFDLLDKLDLMPYVTRIRDQERRRIENAELPERLADLLFREKLLEDLGCLKDVDDRARFEVRMRCANLAKTHDTVEGVLASLAEELKLEDAGLKRLVWRYDLRRHLRGLNLKADAPTPGRARP